MLKIKIAVALFLVALMILPVMMVVRARLARGRAPRRDRD